MNKEDFYKLHIGQKIYYKGELLFVMPLNKTQSKNILVLGKAYYLYHYLNFEDEIDNLSFNKPKEKVKRSRYLLKHKHTKIPFETNKYFIDQAELISIMGYLKEDIDFIVRLNETEREFDE